MSNLKEIRTRITSISKSMQITSAMKMVSAARLKKSQDKIEKMRPYAETSPACVSIMGKSVNDPPPLLSLSLAARSRSLLCK